MRRFFETSLKTGRQASVHPRRLLSASSPRAFSTPRWKSAPEGKGLFMLATNNEDYRVETAVLNRLGDAESGSLRMMTIVGGGDTTLVSLMHPSVGQLTALDMNPNQMHLFRLKLAVAISDLPLERALEFLNLGTDGRTILEESLPSLATESKEFFMEHLDVIEEGILGPQNDNPFNKITRQNFYDELGLDLASFGTMEQADKEKVINHCRHGNHDGLVEEITSTFDKLPWFAALPEEAQKHMKNVLAEVCRMATTRGLGNILQDINVGLLPPSDFYYDILLSGEISKALPPWMSDAGRKILREKATQLTDVLGNVEDLEEGGSNFDVVTLSNIYDFGPEQKAIESIKQVAKKCLKPGGQLIVRRATGKTSEILAGAGGKVNSGEALGLLDFNPLFYRTGDTVASAAF
jgi:hypothetical protein